MAMNNTQHDALFIPCHAFGGGWIVPQSDRALMLLEGLTGEPPAFLEPIQRDGYILEPNELEDVAHYARAHGLTVQLEVE